jgi:hypothetical protein
MSTATAVKSSYASKLKETIGIRRFTGAGPNRPKFDVYVRGKSIFYQAEEFVGGVLQGDRRVFLLVEDIIARQMSLPITAADRVIVKGAELSIIKPAERSADDGTLVAYELQCRG